MRKLRIRVASKVGTLQLFVAATILSAEACGRIAPSPNLSEDSGPGGLVDAPFDPPPPPGPSSGGNRDEYVVDLPEAGVPAEPGQLCAVDAGTVHSGRAARVTLTYRDDLNADGEIEIAEALRSQVVGAPTLDVIDAPFDAGASVFTILSRTATGFSFRVTWPVSTLEYQYGGVVRITVRVRFNIDCDGGLAAVDSANDIHLCDDEQCNPVWVSSGDTCSVCRIIAEMAPSPIVPTKEPDALPLSEALSVRIIEVARISNTVVLFVENDAGPDLSVTWHPSGGELESIAPDIVIWRLGDSLESPFLQAVVANDFGAGIATYSYNQEAS